MLRFLTAGESHGPAEMAILEGIPSGLPLMVEDIQTELDKRRGGKGRGGRGLIESDRVNILSGVRLGKTLGSPLALLVENNDFGTWSKKTQKVTRPRPGHADLAGIIKYGFDDVRNVLERASARETVMRVAVGAVAKKLLAQFQIFVASHTVGIGPIKLSRPPKNFQEVLDVYKTDSDIRCIDRKVSQQMAEQILATTRSKDTLGGVIEVIAHNVPVGLGSHVQWDRKLDGHLAQLLMSIPSVKAVEFGDGIKSSTKPGSQVHDEIIHKSNGFHRLTNHAGGIEGGISNGEDIVIRIFHKPISTLGNPLNSVDIATYEKTKAVIERSDICVVPRAGVISEAMVSVGLVNAFLEKFGGDSISEVKRNFEGFQKFSATR